MNAVSKKGREPIKVEAYAGYKVGETPRKVFLIGRSYDVNLVVYRKRIIDLASYEEEEHFRVELENYGVVNVVYNPRAGTWELDTTIKPEKTFASMVDE